MAHSKPFIIVILAVFLVMILRMDLLAKEAERFSASGSDLRWPEYSLRESGMAIQTGSNIPFPDSSDFILLAQEDYDGDGIPDDPYIPPKGKSYTKEYIVLFVVLLLIGTATLSVLYLEGLGKALGGIDPADPYE